MAAYSPRNRITSRTLEQDIYRVNGFLFAKNPSEYGIFTEQDIAQRRAYIEKNKHKAQFAPLFADWNSAMIRYQERLREIREQTHTGGQVLRQEMEVGNMPSNAMSEPHISDIPVESQETPEEVFQSLKNELETAINQEMDPTEFLEALGIIREIPQNIPTARLLAVRYVFDRMA